MGRLIIADVRSMNTDGKAMGHYFTVADNYVDMFHDDCDILVAGGPVYAGKFFNNLMLLKYDSSNKVSILKNKYHVFCNMKQLFKECKGDTIVLQCSAVATSYIGIFMYKRAETKVFMIQYNVMGLDTKIKRVLYDFARSKVDGIVCPQDKIGRAYRRPYCVVPDYIYVSKHLYDEIPYDEKKYDFGMVGIISEDKGIIEAAQKFRNTEYKVVIAGHPQSKKIEKLLKEVCRNASNIDLKLEYLSEKEYYENIRCSKYCVLNYTGAYTEHSSGVVFDIIFSGIPVVARDCKSMEFIKQRNLGLVYNNINEFRPELVLNEEIYKEYCRNISKYYSEHKTFKSKLKRFLGI